MQLTGLGSFEHINKQKARVVAGVGLLIIIIALLIPFFTEPDPPPGQAGILVNLGIPDVGQGDENGAPPASVEDSSSEAEEETEEEVEEPKEETKPKPKKEKPQPKKEVVKTKDPEAIALERKKKREQELERERQREAATKKRKADEAKRKAAEEAAKRKAAEEKAKSDADALKNALGGAFGGSGNGKGNTGKPGNEGRSDGDPSGLGSVGGGSGTVQGFGDRGFNSPGTLTDNSQSTGRVYVKICVDSSGKVTSAKTTLNGTTATDTRLHRKAESHAKRYKFSRSSNPKQCGTIVYDFKFRG